MDLGAGERLRCRRPVTLWTRPWLVSAREWEN
jgi:hypothetical protein